MRGLARYLVELSGPHSLGVMKDPYLSKAALITAGQILQDICQQVLQNFNLLLNTLISLDERQCLEIRLFIKHRSLISDRTVEPRIGIKPSPLNSVNSFMFLKISSDSGITPGPQPTLQWEFSGNPVIWFATGALSRVKEPARVFALNSLQPHCTLWQLEIRQKGLLLSFWITFLTS